MSGTNAKEGPVGSCLYHVEGAGLDGLESLLNDDDLEELMILGYDKPVRVYHRESGSCETNLILDKTDIDELVERLRKANPYAGSSSYFDARLPDGSRANVILPPISVWGPAVTVRKFPREPISVMKLIESGTLNLDAAALLWLYVEGIWERPANLIVVGGTGTGKTTLLNALTSFFHEEERVITIEDVAELNMAHENWVRLEVPFGSGVTLDDLLKNALRMRPDRIVVGEVRGSEAETLFNAMNTGHEGVLGTLHANSAYDALRRLNSTPMNVPKQMLRLLDVIVVMGVVVTGGRRRRMVVEISETSGGEQDLPRISTIMKLERETLSLVPTGVPSGFRDMLAGRSGMSPRQVAEELGRRRSFLGKLVGGTGGFRGFYDHVQDYYRSEKSHAR